MRFSTELKNKGCLRGYLKIKKIAILAIFLIVISNISLAATNRSIGRTNKSSKSLRSLARVYMAYGNYDKAMPIAEKALILARSSLDNEAEISSCYGDLAYLYRNLGDYERSEKMCKEGLRIQKLAYFDTHPYVAYSLKTLSGIYRDQRKFKEAENSLTEAFAIMLDTHGPDEHSMAPFYVEFAKLHAEKRDFALAEQYYNKSLTLIYKSYGPEHIYTAGVLNNAAEYYILCGKFNKAKTLADQALSIQEKVYGNDHHLLTSTWLTLATISQAHGNDIAATTLINKAFTAVTKTGDTIAIAKLNRKLAEIGITDSYQTVAANIK